MSSACKRYTKVVQITRCMLIAAKRLKLRSSNLTRMFPVTVDNSLSGNVHSHERRLVCECISERIIKISLRLLSHRNKSGTLFMAHSILVSNVFWVVVGFGAVMLLAVWQEGHPASKRYRYCETWVLVSRCLEALFSESWSLVLSLGLEPESLESKPASNSQKFISRPLA